MKDKIRILLQYIRLLNVFRLILRKVNYIYERTYWVLMGKYRPEWYWERRGKRFINEERQRIIEPSHYWLLEVINDLKPRSILEVGCGFGRNIRFLLENINYKIEFTGVDISNSMIEKSSKFLAGLRGYVIKRGDVRNLEFKDNSFDLVFTFGTLMHINFEEIDKAMKELKRVSLLYVVSIEEAYGNRIPDKDGNLNINQFTFSRNYVKLFKRYHLEIVKYTLLYPCLFGIIGKKKIS